MLCDWCDEPVFEDDQKDVVVGGRELSFHDYCYPDWKKAVDSFDEERWLRDMERAADEAAAGIPFGGSE